jgi:hypothetical protein
MSLIFLSLLRLLMRMICLMNFFELNILLLLLLLLIMLYINLSRIMKVRSSGKKEKRLMIFSFIKHC